MWFRNFCFANEKNFNEIYGLEISQSRIKEARERAEREFPGDKGIHFVVGDMEKELNFPANNFDVITSLAVIEHLFNVYSAMREIHRILGPSGILY